jgi:hypothetical protein
MRLFDRLTNGERGRHQVQEGQEMIATTEIFSLKIARKQCVDCCAGSQKYIIWCSCDGCHSTWCYLWPFRFGQRPETFRQKHGPWLLMPECMPDPTVELDDLPSSPSEAVAWFREKHPEVAWDGPKRSEMNVQERDRLRRQLAKAREAKSHD